MYGWGELWGLGKLRWEASKYGLKTTCLSKFYSPHGKGSSKIFWKVKSESESCSVMSVSLPSHGLYSPWNSPGPNTGVGSLSLLQGIFPTQGSNPGVPHCRWILYQLSHKGSPRILEWVAYPFASRSSWPKNWTGVSCIAGRFFTTWAMREAPDLLERATKWTEKTLSWV